jgi:soluble cytochrome b562
MKIRTLFTSSVLALTLGSVAFAQGGPGGPGPGGAPANAAPKTPLEEQMGKINTANMALRSGRGGAADVADASKQAEAIKQVAVIKAAANEALKLVPKYTPATVVTEADKAKYVSDYQAVMKKFITAVETLETALKAGKSPEEIAPLYAALGMIQSQEGHNTFRAPRGGRGGAPGGPGGGGAPGGGGPGGPGGGAPRGN